MNAVPRPPGAPGHGALHLVGATSSAGGSAFPAPSCAAGLSKRKRRPAGTPGMRACLPALVVLQGACLHSQPVPLRALIGALARCCSVRHHERLVVECVMLGERC